MCGRYVSFRPLTALSEWFLVDEVRTEPLPPSWNVAPTDPVYAVAEHEGRRLLGSFQWGLVPPGAPDPARGVRRINARAETVVKRSLFREAFARRRCLLPGDGFYEWESRNGREALVHRTRRRRRHGDGGRPVVDRTGGFLTVDLGQVIRRTAPPLQ